MDLLLYRINSLNINDIVYVSPVKGERSDLRDIKIQKRRN